MDTTDVLRGPAVNMRRHWDGAYHIEDAHSREVLLVGTKEQCLTEYDKRNAAAIHRKRGR